MSTDWKALCAELADALDAWQLGGGPPEDTADADLIARARTALAQPEPEGVTDQEIADTFAQGCREGAGNPDQPPFLAGARAVLARYARPTIKPVTVSERPWEREGWCDAEGNLWAEHISREGTASWRYANRDFLGGWCQRCLPHHALPLPTP